VLVLAVELSSLHFQRSLRPEDLRGHALFADGAGAAIVASGVGTTGPLGAGQLELGRGSSRLLPGTADQMTWTVGDHGFLMGLASTVPASLAAAIPELVSRTTGGGDEVLHWAVHPGGPAVLDRVEEGMGLLPDALADSRAVLRDHGNLSSATVFLVLERVAARPDSGPGIALAFGPGLTAEALAFRK
jgi:predicted naringenin-chalcone synthase